MKVKTEEIYKINYIKRPEMWAREIQWLWEKSVLLQITLLAETHLAEALNLI